MISRFITIEHPGEWNDFVRRCDTHDVYHLAEYQQAPTPMDEGLPTLAVVEDTASGFAAALPLRIRPLSTIPEIYENDGFDEKLLDAVSPDQVLSLALGELGSVDHREWDPALLARFHYALNGAGWLPHEIAPTARELAGFLKEDQVNAVLLVPV